MALKDLFKSKAAKLKPDPRIRWFGKLPSYPDYYSSRADEEWVVEFNDWVLKGFELYRSRQADDRKPAGRLPVSGCAIRLPKSEMTILASILDFGGDMRGRPFPMCFYAAVPTAQWPGPTSDRMAGASRVIRDLLALGREVARFLNSPGRFEAVFGDREVDLADIDSESTDTSWLAAAKAVELADWFECARARIKVQDPATWVKLARAWGETLASHESATFEPTLRLPLAMRMATESQVAGWIRWLESRMDLKRRCLSLVVSGDTEDSAGSLSVIARVVVPEDFLLLTPLAGTLPYLDDLSVVEPPGSPGSGEQDSDLESPRAGSLGRWADFLCDPVTAA